MIVTSLCVRTGFDTIENNVICHQALTYPILMAHRTSSVLVLVNVFAYMLLMIFPTLAVV